MSIGAFVFANLIVAVIVANLELSVKDMREEEKRANNPLEYKVKRLWVILVIRINFGFLIAGRFWECGGNAANL